MGNYKPTKELHIFTSIAETPSAAGH